MKPPSDIIRLGKQSRDQLIKLKRHTGIESWNIICRWAFCASLRETSLPPLDKTSAKDGVEISWSVFAGDASDYYAGLLLIWRRNYATNCKDVDDAALLHAHIRRGLGYLAAGTETRSISDFTKRWLEVG